MLNRYIRSVFFIFHFSHSHDSFLFGSFWGKFGERVNKPTTVTVKDQSHLFSLLSEYALDISTLRLCTEYTLEAVYTSVHDNAVKDTKTKIFIAAFTTCHARLKLYESLDALQVSKSFTMIPIVWCTNGAPINPSSPLATFLGT